MSEETINYEQVNSANLTIYHELRRQLWTKVLETEALRNIKVEILDSQCPSCNKFIDASVKTCPHCSCEFNSKTTKVFKKVDAPGKGRKFCPGCKKFIAVRTYVCDCGYDHKNKIQTEAKQIENKQNNIKRKKSNLYTIEEVLDLDILIKNDEVKSNFLRLLTEETNTNNEIKSICSELIRKRDQIWKFNQKLNYDYASKFWPKSGCKHLKKEDFISVGNLGVMEAINHFNAEYKVDYKGSEKFASFSTYCTFWIKKKIINEINEREKEIRVPEHILNIYKTFTNYVNEFRKNNDREPELEDIMRDQNVKEKKARGLLFAKEYKSASGMSIEDVNRFADSEVENKKGHANLKFNNGSLDTHRLTENLNEDTLELTKINWANIKFKNETYKNVFCHYLGICGYSEMTPDAIKNQYGISPATTKNIYLRTIAAIRNDLGIT